MSSISGTKCRCELLFCIWGEKEKPFKVTFKLERSFINIFVSNSNLLHWLGGCTRAFPEMHKVLKPGFWSYSSNIQHAAFGWTFEGPVNTEVFLLNSVFWLACLLHFWSRAFRPFLHYSLLRLHFEVLTPNVKIVLSSLFIYEMKAYSVEVLKFRSFLFLMWLLNFYFFLYISFFLLTYPSIQLKNRVNLFTERENCGAYWSQWLAFGMLHATKHLLVPALLCTALDWSRPDCWQGQWYSFFHTACGGEREREWKTG